MKGKNKQLLGFVGLASVFALTAVAYTLPAPEAAAQDLNISVTVTAEEGSARIVSPTPGAVLTDRNATVSVSYNKMSTLSTSLKCTDKEGAEVFNEAKDVTLTQTTGVENVAFALPESVTAGGASCVANMEAKGLDGLTYPDSVSFAFRAMNVPNPGTEEKPNKPGDEDCKEGETCGKVDDENNPVVDVNVSDEVQKVSVQVYDTENNPIFVDKDGKETPLLTTKDAFKDGKVTITLPMADYNAKPGKYVAYFTATNSKNEVISVNEYWFEYMPKVETPGTGSILKDLNLSRADYLVAGLAAFGAVAGFAMYLVFRKSRR